MEGEWAMSNIVMEDTWCSSEKQSETKYGRERSSWEQHQCMVGEITESQEKPLDVPMEETCAKRSKEVSDSQGP